ncbi:MAG: chorismate-binding protein, partial [Pseudomonadota bacterium]
TPRGAYCGATGYIDDRGAAAFSVSIRTLTSKRSGSDGWRAQFGVGGGVVAKSDPAAEYEETLDKAAAFLNAFGLAREDIGSELTPLTVANAP